MAADPPDFDPARLSPEALTQLNRATLVVHTVRTAVHELNNVFQMISGSAEMLSESTALPANAAPRLDAILRQSARGHAILQSVAGLARREAPGASVVDVASALDSVLEARRYEHTRAQIAASVGRAPGTVARVRVDPQHLRQILLNLVINAEEALAGQSSKTLTLEVGQSGEDVMVAVADNGPGVSAEADPFEAFATTKGERAAGLGLTVSRILAASYGGALERAESPDGARWVLRLPAAS